MGVFSGAQIAITSFALRSPGSGQAELGTFLSISHALMRVWTQFLLLHCI